MARMNTLSRLSPSLVSHTLWARSTILASLVRRSSVAARGRPGEVREPHNGEEADVARALAYGVADLAGEKVPAEGAYGEEAHREHERAGQRAFQHQIGARAKGYHQPGQEAERRVG